MRGFGFQVFGFRALETSSGFDFEFSASGPGILALKSARNLQVEPGLTFPFQAFGSDVRFRKDPTANICHLR